MLFNTQERPIFHRFFFHLILSFVKSRPNQLVALGDYVKQTYLFASGVKEGTKKEENQRKESIQQALNLIIIVVMIQNNKNK